jgi:hypothetical protein
MKLQTPEALGAFIWDVEIESTSGVALSGAEDLPVGGFVGGAGVALWIGETLLYDDDYFSQ